MNKNLIITALLIAVSCQSVSAALPPKVDVPVSMMSKMYTKVRSFVGNNYKVMGATALSICVLSILRVRYKKALTNSLQRLVADVKKAVDGQKRYITFQDLEACEPEDNLYGTLDARNYPCVAKDTMKVANEYICKKNVLLKPGMSYRETIQIKNCINQTLAVLNDRIHRNMPLYPDEVLGDFFLRHQLKFEILA